jgi:hypothetical protein
MQVAIATIRIKLRILPTPRYAIRIKDVKAIVVIIPRRLFAKTSENVKRKQKKIRTKKAGIDPK